jgi:hypothetical protein
MVEELKEEAMEGVDEQKNTIPETHSIPSASRASLSLATSSLLHYVSSMEPYIGDQLTEKTFAFRCHAFYCL